MAFAFYRYGYWPLALAAMCPVQAFSQDVGLVAESGDIVVTAQRTQSLASKTPIALSAISPETLRDANVTNPTALGDLVPNLNIVRTDGLRITIRGVRSSDNTEKGDPSAAFLLDGIYLARPQVQEVSFYDIARVEVLRGPQGTLYGRNTTAGLINVISNRPSDRFEAAGNVSYGNYETWQADAMVNLPVNDALSLRLAGSFDRRDAYLIPNADERFRLTPFKNNLSGRAQALIKLGDAELLLRADYSSMKGFPQNVQPSTRFYDVTVPTGQPAYTDPRYIGGGFSSRELRALNYALTRESTSDDYTWGIGGEFNWDVGPLTLTYLGSFREFHRDSAGTTFAAAPYQNPFKGTYRQNSQELRFATNGSGPLQLQFGGYYFREESAILAYALNVVPGVPWYGFEQDPTTSKTVGLFGQATYSVTPSLRVTAGARYSDDEKGHTGFNLFQQGPVYNPATDRRLLQFTNLKSNKITWRAGVDFDLDARSLLYGTVSTGYKAGGFNSGCPAGSTANGIVCNQPMPDQTLYYRPETLTAYELGVKTRLAGNALSLNASAFYYDYQNLQLTSRINLNGVATQFTGNAGKARVKGVELEAVAKPSPRNRFDAALTWLDAEYVRYLPRGEGSAPDYAGRPLDYSPKLTVNAGYAYSYPFDGGATLTVGVRSRLSSSYVMTDFATPRQVVQPSNTKTDINLTYSAPGDRWYIQGYLKNVEDTILVNSISLSGGVIAVTTGDPRTYGLRTGFRF